MLPDSLVAFFLVVIAIGLVVMIILLCALLYALWMMVKQLRPILMRLDEISKVASVTTQKLGRTVATVNDSLIEPIALASGFLAGTRKGFAILGLKKVLEFVSSKKKGRS